MNEVFLSYKRGDDPGYVARLADSLERAFGAGSVYRDVDSERAGDDWKRSLARNVAGARVVLAVIGPNWQEILSGTAGGQDWVRFELNQARTLDVPIIPVRLAHAGFDHGRDLGDLEWIKERQFFELADGQGRWGSDIARLVGEIEQATSLKAVTVDGSTPSVAQTSHGDQSPNIVSGGGPVTISFGDKD